MAAQEKKKMSLKEQADKIMEIAEHYNAQGNFLFRTTFQRYMTQINLLSRLQEEFKDPESVMVTKEYVKGRGNLYTNPAIGEYNKTATAANQTAQTLIKILKELAANRDEAGDDPLMAILAGGGLGE